ncbi:MAG: chromosome segregation protein SMC [bacterium]
MRLEKIKLAGFKSFVDPTTVNFPSNLVGVVGPNGCGKSNVIDAVRWVMGESSAKMLRGESMADVIFNGSSTRKPVGTASIELIFDNSDGAAGGQYAQYGQIAVKRQVTRDGQSNYFLNSVRCRRRDITDLFLGTGLGPRSYAIIEQGMISRVIESKPEELRVYLEEAAGISKYKERRRETENRIKLERLSDLIEEVDKQLKRLERQSATAEKYKTLKAEERQAAAELLVLRIAEMADDLAGRDRVIAEQENRLEQAIAQQRKIESDIETQRSAHADANESFNEVQGRYYAAGSEIARLEEAIQYARDTRNRQQRELERTQAALTDAESHRTLDEDKLAELAQSLTQDQPELEAARQRAEESTSQLQSAEKNMQEWQQEWDTFNTEAAQPAQQAQVDRTRINHLEQQENQLRHRIERLEKERGQLADVELDAEIAELERQQNEQKGQVDQYRGDAERLVGEIQGLREGAGQQQQELADTRGELEVINGRLSSLQALQQAALGDDEEGLQQWLRDAGLENARRLLGELKVSADWQTAVEAVLAEQLQASCVDDLSEYSDRVGQLSAGRLNLFELNSEPPGSVAGTLAAQVEGPGSLQRLLAGVKTAEDVADAMSMGAQLADGESIVTRDGIWLGRHWLRYYQVQDAQAGMLAREQEIRELSEKQQSLGPRVETLKTAMEQAQTSLVEKEHGREQAQQALDKAGRQLAEIVSRLGGKKARADHIRQRLGALKSETDEIRKQLQQGTEEMESARQSLHAHLEKVETLGVRREQLVARRERLQTELNESRERARVAGSDAHQIALRVESMRSSEVSLRSGIERMQSQLSQLHQQQAELTESLSTSEKPLADQQGALEEKLQHRVQVEAALGEARKSLESIDALLRDLEKQRHQAEQQVQDNRQRLEKKRFDRQEVVVRSRTLDEQLQETGMNKDELIANLPEEATVEAWRDLVETLERRIQRLGPINLAAIDEFKEQTERMEYLQSQFDDVTGALTTLENAIHKIDKETRTRFKETFELVNTGLKNMFPKLFGGGHAYLELVGEDLLDAGVAIMARPPGKRNASIHLLSGGEKALSAVALVFSIFQLNPAPFCMLDEVDAPLDDANVGRFCDLVKEMAESVQFIFITHNKVTMEIASQLTGVTMHEPGCSRLVSVDVDEAAEMAAM